MTVFQEFIKEIQEIKATCKTMQESLFFDGVLAIAEKYIQKEGILQWKDTPPWEIIPLEFNWRAQDSNGDWWAYRKKPKQGRSVNWWVGDWDEGSDNEKHLGRSAPNPNWLNTIEQRPG